VAESGGSPVVSRPARRCAGREDDVYRQRARVGQMSRPAGQSKGSSLFETVRRTKDSNCQRGGRM